jgi:hypothetical protein
VRGVAKLTYEDAYSVIEPQITSAGIHVFPFAPAFPVDVRFMRWGSKRDIRMNCHDYFELLCVHSGEVAYQVQDQHFHLRQSDLFLTGC